MARKLPNYLRTYRRYTGLSQDEVAFLLGCDGSAVTYYERSARRPPVESILAFEMIFGAPARDLFAGVCDKVEENTRTRATVLAQKLSAKAPDPITTRKLEVLRNIASASGRELAQSA